MNFSAGLSLFTNLVLKILGSLFGCHTNSSMSWFEKWSTLDPKNFYAIPFQKFVFLVSLYLEFLEKKQRNQKKVIFGQFSVFLFRFSC